MKANRISLAAAAVAVIAGTTPAVADQDSAVETREAFAVPPVVVSEKAEQLQRDAEALYSQPKQWKRAVRMLEQSAALRNANDPDAYHCLLYAGRIKAAIGDMSGARVNLEKAAAHALARGAIADAAQAYIDAAHAAVALRDARGAQDLVGRATLLVDSPLLTVSQRELLKSRLAAA